MENTRESSFRIDLYNEGILNSLMIEYIYPLLYPDAESIIRVKDIELQKRGIDIIVKDKKGNKVYIDEKAQMNYINRPLKTNAFELSFLSGGLIRTGWFVKDKMLTDYYILIYPEIKKRYIIGNKVEEDDYTRLTIELFRKQELIEKIEKDFGLSKERLKKTVRSIIFDGIDGKIKEVEGTKDLYYVYSKQLRERPINLVIKREYLSKLPSFSKRIFKFKEE